MKKIFTILGMLFTLSVNAQQVTILGPASICDQDSATLIAQVPGFNTDTLIFEWSLNSQSFSQGINNDTIVVSPGSGVWNYSVSVFTPQGVAVFFPNISGSTGTTTLTVNPNPTATASNGGPYCVNQTIQLQAGGGSSYLWSGPNGFSSSLQNPTITQAQLVANGTYTVTVTDGNNCSATATTSVVVNANPIPTISVSPNDTVCLGTQVALFATGGVSYSWSVGGNGPSTTWTPTTTGNLVPSVFVTDANGCSALEFLPMVVNPTPAVTAVANDVLCFGDSSGSASVSQSGLSYLWNTGDTTQTVSGLPAGSYSVTVTNNFGCSATANATVNQPLAAVTVDSLSITDALCNGASDGSITVHASGGMGFYGYAWSNGSIGNSQINLSAGTYTITVTDGNGCTASATGVVGEPAFLTANVDSIPVSCFGAGDGGAFVSFVSGGTQPFTYLWSNGATGSSTTGLTVGTYTVTITDANGCQVSAGTVVTQPADITLSSAVTSVTCNGGGNGSIDLTVNGGTSPYTYLWSNGFTGQDPQGLVAGIHDVIVTDANGCTATGSWVVNQPSALTTIVSTTNATCLGNGNGTASISVSGGTAPYGYVWNNGATTSSINAPAGNYTVTITDGNGCQALALATIGTPVPIQASGVITPVSCYAGNDGAIDLTVTGSAPFTYVWNNGATTQDLTGLGWGTYTVTITAANGCDTSLTFSLSQPAPLGAQASATNASCFGGLGSATVLATGGTGNYSFQWSPSGGTGSSASNLPVGAYTVTVTDANGCTAQASTVVIQPSEMVASIQSQTNAGCFGNSNGAITVTAAGGTEPYSPLVEWSDGSTTVGFYRSGLTPGTYTATITDANGCSASVTTTINGPTSPIVVQWYAVQNPCSGTNNGGITVNASGGVGPYTFTWGDGFVGPIRTGLTAGTYTVTITDATGCQAGPFGQTLTANQGLSITTPSVVNYCVGSGETISLTATGGTQPYGYQWTSPNGTFFGTSQEIEPMVNGQYLGGIWTGVVTDGLGCSQTTYITVNLITCTTTSINEQSNDGFNVVVYPNPISFGGRATVRLPLNIYDVSIQLLDITGKILSQEKATGEIHQLNTSGLAAGTYIVRIVSGAEVVTKRLIIQ